MQFKILTLFVAISVVNGAIYPRVANAVSIIEPNANTVWRAGGTYNVRWAVLAQNLIGKLLTIQLRNDKLSYYLEDNVPAGNQFTVTVPDDVEVGLWRIRISDFNERDYGDSVNFNVQPQSTTTVPPTTTSKPTTTSTTPIPTTTSKPNTTSITKPTTSTTSTPKPTPTQTCVQPTGGCVFGTWSNNNCKCMCIGEAGYNIGWCPDRTGRCLISKRWDPFRRIYQACGTFNAPRPSQTDDCDDECHECE